MPLASNSRFPFCRDRTTFRRAQLFQEFRVQQERERCPPGGRIDEELDEQDWKIAVAGGVDFALRAGACGLRRARGEYLRPGYSDFEASGLGMAAGAGKTSSEKRKAG